MKAARFHEHRRVCRFLHLHFICCVCQQLGKVLFDQVQIVMPTVEAQDWDLVAPFLCTLSNKSLAVNTRLCRNMFSCMLSAGAGAAHLVNRSLFALLSRFSHGVGDGKLV